MKLEDRKWKEFNFTDIFIIKNGFYNKKPPVEDKGDIPFLGAVDKNNGVTEFYTKETINNNSKTGKGLSEPLEKKIFKGNCICVTNNGSVGYAYYQKTQFTCSHDINPLYLKDYILTEELAMFIINTIEKQRICFEYSRKWRPKRMKKSKILLPVDTKDNPDWQFMENYARNILIIKKNKYKAYINDTIKKLSYKEIKPLHKKNWKEFFVTDIFSIPQRGKRLIKLNQVKGNMPYISSTASNNGIDNFIGNNTKVRFFENCLTIANSGSVGASFYHKYKFIASDHVTHLKKDNMSEYVYLFISALTNRFKQKYNFNREINDKRISREKILLPIDDNEKPDYNYMEQYIKNLKYKKLVKYMEKVNKIQYKTDKFINEVYY